jgi:hypothetical protein
MKKNQNMPVCLSKMVLTLHFRTGYWGWQKAQQSLTSAIDWRDGFDWFRRVAISSLPPFAVPVSVLWVRLGKSK